MKSSIDATLKHKVCAFGRHNDGRTVFYQVKVTVCSDAEPGMLAIMKGFGNGIELNDLAVKGGAFGQVLYRKRNMIQFRLLACAKEAAGNAISTRQASTLLRRIFFIPPIYCEFYCQQKAAKGGQLEVSVRDDHLFVCFAREGCRLYSYLPQKNIGILCEYPDE